MMARTIRTPTGMPTPAPNFAVEEFEEFEELSSEEVKIDPVAEVVVVPLAEVSVRRLAEEFEESEGLSSEELKVDPVAEVQ